MLGEQSQQMGFGDLEGQFPDPCNLDQKGSSLSRKCKHADP